MAPQLENMWSSHKTLFSVLLLIHAVVVNLAPNIFHSGSFRTRKKEMVGMILDVSWMSYYNVSR